MNLPMVMIFFVSKLLRYGLFLVFLFLLMSGVKNLGGYSREQIIIFYLVFNLIDTLGQLLFREVYYFRPLVISGNFDMVLTKPFNPLIRVLLGGPDLIDTGVFVILVGVLSNFVRLDSFLIFYFVLMLINSLLITAAFYISILAIGILTLSVDHLIMIYRDLSSLMRIPVDIFTNPLRTLLTFIIPIGIMFTFPAKVLFGLLSWQLILFSFLFGVVSLFLSLKFWNYSLRQYQSASS
ncbi:MAG: ABC-2 family transporter protein [Patescibacteria group bacterium]